MMFILGVRTATSINDFCSSCERKKELDNLVLVLIKENVTTNDVNIAKNSGDKRIVTISVFIFLKIQDRCWSTVNLAFMKFRKWSFFKSDSFESSY